jgi:pyroglutamyl-peptidase
VNLPYVDRCHVRRRGRAWQTDLVKTILVTGFGAFGHTHINPAKLVAEALDGSSISGADVHACIVPCVFFDCIESATAAVDEVRPDAILMMGEYGGRSSVTVERIAQNFNDSSRYGLADNEGRVIINEPTVTGGPAAHFATLPIRSMVLAMRAEGIPADISDTGGTNLCNHLMYGVLHHVASRDLRIPTGWIHLPHLPVTAALDENLGAPSMSVATATAGVTVAIQAIFENQEDVKSPVPSRWQI